MDDKEQLSQKRKKSIERAIREVVLTWNG